VVFDAETTAALLRSTIGYATEFDRVRGDDVNATGTSYLSAASLGQSLASPLVTITASRSEPHGPAAVAWDDEGIVPTPFPLVQAGVLVDFATSRAEALALAAWYQRRGEPVRSRGCAVADTAADLPLVAPPDLMLHPATAETSFDDLVAAMGTGVAVLRGDCDLDQAQRVGQGWGAIYEIRNGRLGRYLGETAAFAFRSPDLWHNVIALGGPSSARARGFTATKGQPEQRAAHGVWAVPMVVRDVVLMNMQQN